MSAVLMDVFTRMIRGWQVSRHLNQPLTLEPLEQALCQSVPEIHHSDQGVQYLSNAYITTLMRHGIEVSLVRRGCPWGERVGFRKTHPNPQGRRSSPQ